MHARPRAWRLAIGEACAAVHGSLAAHARCALIHARTACTAQVVMAARISLLQSMTFIHKAVGSNPSDLQRVASYCADEAYDAGGGVLKCWWCWCCCAGGGTWWRSTRVQACMRVCFLCLCLVHTLAVCGQCVMARKAVRMAPLHEAVRGVRLPCAGATILDPASFPNKIFIIMEGEAREVGGARAPVLLCWGRPHCRLLLMESNELAASAPACPLSRGCTERAAGCGGALWRARCQLLT